MFPTRNFERLVINALPIFPHTSVTPSNLKRSLEVLKASRKLVDKFEGKGGVTVK